jgi:quercetin dioxygenase-like cupin family protein
MKDEGSIRSRRGYAGEPRHDQAAQSFGLPIDDQSAVTTRGEDALARTSGRIRRPPAERFAGPEHVFNLPTMASTLWREDHPGANGHKQITLFHEGDVALVLFDFIAGGVLADHEADGYVTIHTVAGELEVATSETIHHLPAGSLLVLAPGVRHDVTARVASSMLLTVHLVRPDAP